jgi:hypothetical protein
MPAMCFSYPPDIRPGIGKRNIAQPDLRNPRMMPIMCFRYEADAPRRMPLSCLSYPQMCFGYPADVPPGDRDAGFARSAQHAVRLLPLLTEPIGGAYAVSMFQLFG